MAQAAPQNYANHRRYVPLFHFVTSLFLILNLVAAIWQAWHAFGFASAVAVLTALALLSLFLYCRAFPLTVQDRVIRLEERLRLERLLPAAERGQIDQLRRGQFVALRFASDDELPALFREVVAGRLQKPEAIKRAIKTWRPDYLRA
jgi:hypothetical protein